MKIRFAKQLNALREGELKEVCFPANLEIVERKFIHKLSEELGLKSKSSGKGENRYITVRKPMGGATGGVGRDGQELEVPKFKFTSASLKTLRPLLLSGNSGGSGGEGMGGAGLTSVRSSGRNAHKSKSLAEENDFLRASHARAEAERRAHPGYKEMQRGRAKLSSASYKDELCHMVMHNQVCLVSGETGCGKTTQVPQFILDDPTMGPGCKIAVTQPRRISAISVAERMAQERCESVGKSIAYNIKLESAKSRGSQVVFMTPGVLLRKLHNDGDLAEFSHIIVDEAHERDRFTEFAIMILRDIMKRRLDIRLILMSATMHTAKLCDYFGGIPQLCMGGSMFPVEEFFLEDALDATDYSDRGYGAAAGGVIDFAMPLESKADLKCIMCGQTGFRTPQELGTHSAMCLGVPSSGAMRGASSTQEAPSKKQEKNSLSALESLLRGISATTDAVVVQSGIKASPAPPSIFDTMSGLSSALDGDGDGGEDEDMDRQLDGIGNSSSSQVGDLRAAEGEVDKRVEAMMRHYQATRDDSKVDCVLLLQLLKYIFKSEFSKDRGSVLVFLPGWQEISEMSDILKASHEFHDQNVYKIIQLHSQVPKKNQMEAFKRAKAGCFKIILSTNIAETSITIDDVNVVVNSGRSKEKTYDPHTKLCYLKTGWISKSSARQRKGRAGRTSAGVCYHLFSRRRHKELPDFQESEILRMPLEELVLQTKCLNLAPGRGDDGDSVQAFLMKAMDPPHTLSISHSIELLTTIGCLERHTERLTVLGDTVSRLPMDPRLGRTIVLACLMGCGPSALKAASTMGYRDPFVIGIGESERERVTKVRMAFSAGNPSDQVTLFAALNGYISAMKKGGAGKASGFCREKCLSNNTMTFLNDFVYQLQRIMDDMQLNTATNPRFARNEGNTALVASVLGMGMYPDVGVRKKGAKAFQTEKGRKAKIHPSSVVAKLKGYGKKVQMDYGLHAVTYQGLVESKGDEDRGFGGVSLSMCDCSFLNTFALLLTCGEVVEQERTPGSGDEDDAATGEPLVRVAVDNWVALQMSRECFVLVAESRAIIEQSMTALVTNPGKPLPKDLEMRLNSVITVIANEQEANVATAFPNTY